MARAWVLRYLLSLASCMSTFAFVGLGGGALFSPLACRSGGGGQQAVSVLKGRMMMMRGARPEGGSRGLTSEVGIARLRCVASTEAEQADGKVLSSDRTAALPWTESVAGPGHKLLYMPFVEWQMKFMREVMDLEDLPFEKQFSFQNSTVKPAVIESWQFKSEYFRKIRLTYIDAGTSAQVFNCVFYPKYEYDIPIFGIDFLQFGKKKVIAILDLQPLEQDPTYLSKYIDPLIPLRNKYEDLCGRMSSKFYDEVQFFSQQLLFGKFDNDSPVMESLFPAFKEYMQHYLELVRSTPPNREPAFLQRVRQLHKDYDTYSAQKDPAVGLFATYWGEDWAQKFMYNFLFSDAEEAAPPAAH